MFGLSFASMVLETMKVDKNGSPLNSLAEELGALYKSMQESNVRGIFKQLQRTSPKLNPDVIYRRNNLGAKEG